MVSATDGSAFTGSVTVYVTGDAGTQAVGSVGAGACTHEGNGFHTYAPAQAETNYNHVAFTFIGTGAVPQTVQIYTSFPQSVDLSTGITAGTITTVTNLTNLPAITAGWLTATGIAADAITAAKVAADVGTEIGTAVWATTTRQLTGSQAFDLTGNITGNMSGSVGSVTTVNGLAAGVITAASIAADAITDAKVAADVTIASVTGAVGSVTGNVGGNVTGSVGSVVGAVGSVTGAVGSVTGLTASDVGAIKAKTDSLTFTQAGHVDANIQRINDVLITGDGSGTPFNV